MHQFISDVKLMPQDNVLLNLDGHDSYTLSVAAVEIARKHGVAMLSLQPLDVTFFFFNFVGWDLNPLRSLFQVL
jgi:hypothetical protein